MGQIENTIAVYERLQKTKYKVTVENGIEFILSFEPDHYHHLAGFHYLTDLVGIATPKYGKHRFYKQMKRHTIREEDIVKSALYESISERIQFFGYIEDIVSASDCKIIVEFDKGKASSDIEAKFFLYKREGNPLNQEPVTYYTLFIGYDTADDLYYPATYIVEHSKKYVSGQVMLNCKIEAISTQSEEAQNSQIDIL